MHVLVVSDASDADRLAPAPPAGSAGAAARPAALSHHISVPSADRELADALGRTGVRVSHATWLAVAGGAVSFAGIDVVHLRPAGSRRGPRTGDRRIAGRPLRVGLPWLLDRRRSGRSDRRSATGVLAHLPPDLPVVLTLPGTPPARVDQRTSRVVHVPRAVVVERAVSGSRPVHVIAADAAAAVGLESVLPGTHAASIAQIGRGFAEPPHVRPFRVAGPVVLVITTTGDAREAVTALKAAETVGRTGQRFTLVIAGAGPTVRGVLRAAALTESTGVLVRFLGRATPGELRRWQATAAVCIASSAAEGADTDVSDMLLSGIPVLAPRTPVLADVAAQASTPPVWYAEGDAAELAVVLERVLLAAPASRPSDIGNDAADDKSRPLLLPLGSGLAAAPDELAAVGDPDRSRALPSWDDIAQQTRWVYHQAVRAQRG